MKAVSAAFSPGFAFGGKVWYAQTEDDPAAGRKRGREG